MYKRYHVRKEKGSFTRTLFENIKNLTWHSDQQNYVRVKEAYEIIPY